MAPNNKKDKNNQAVTANKKTDCENSFFCNIEKGQCCCKMRLDEPETWMCEYMKFSCFFINNIYQVIMVKFAAHTIGFVDNMQAYTIFERIIVLIFVLQLYNANIRYDHMGLMTRSLNNRAFRYAFLLPFALLHFTKYLIARGRFLITFCLRGSNASKGHSSSNMDGSN